MRKKGRFFQKKADWMVIESGLEPRRGGMSIVSRCYVAEPRRGGMFIVWRSPCAQPRRGGMACALTVYAAPTELGNPRAISTINIAPLRGYFYGVAKLTSGAMNIAPLRGCQAERTIAASQCRDPNPTSNYTLRTALPDLIA